jgi:hypothetical protein
MSVCNCQTLSYALCFNNLTDQGDETKDSEREGLEMDGLEMERLEREGVKRLLFKHNIRTM